MTIVQGVEAFIWCALMGTLLYVMLWLSTDRGTREPSVRRDPGYVEKARVALQSPRCPQRNARLPLARRERRRVHHWRKHC